MPQRSKQLMRKGGAWTPMTSSSRTAIAVTLLSLCLCTAAHAAFAIIDIPGADGVSPMAINDKGQVAGSYVDSAGVYHGFLWKPDGTLATFEVAGTSKRRSLIRASPARERRTWRVVSAAAVSASAPQ